MSIGAPRNQRPAAVGGADQCARDLGRSGVATPRSGGSLAHPTVVQWHQTSIAPDSAVSLAAGRPRPNAGPVWPARAPMSLHHVSILSKPQSTLPQHVSLQPLALISWHNGEMNVVRFLPALSVGMLIFGPSSVCLSAYSPSDTCTLRPPTAAAEFSLVRWRPIHRHFR